MTAIVPSVPTQIVQTFTAPTDGTIANAASVNVAFQALEDSAEALRYLTYGGGLRRRVVGTSSTSMTIQPLGAVVVLVAGVWTVVPHTVATTINPQTLAGGAFAASTRYYVYVNVVAGAIVWSVSTTAPDVGLRYKSGDEQYQFISTFRTDSFLALIPYTQDDNVYTYTGLTIPGAVDGNLVLNEGHATVAAAVSFGTVAPAAASRVDYLFEVQGGVTFAGRVTDSGGSTPRISGGGDGTVVAVFSAQAQTVGTGVEYLVDNAATAAWLWVTGFVY